MLQFNIRSPARLIYQTVTYMTKKYKTGAEFQPQNEVWSGDIVYCGDLLLAEMKGWVTCGGGYRIDGNSSWMVKRVYYEPELFSCHKALFTAIANKDKLFLVEGSEVFNHSSEGFYVNKFGKIMRPQTPTLWRPFCSVFDCPDKPTERMSVVARWSTTGFVSAGFVSTLRNQKDGKRLASVTRSENTFARQNEYDFEIYTNQSITLCGTMARPYQIDSILRKIFSPSVDIEPFRLVVTLS